MLRDDVALRASSCLVRDKDRNKFKYKRDEREQTSQAAQQKCFGFVYTARDEFPYRGTQSGPSKGREICPPCA